MSKWYLGSVVLSVAGCLGIVVCGLCGSGVKVSGEDLYLELVRSKEPEEVTLGELYEVSDWVVMGIVEGVEVRVSGYDERPERAPEEMRFIRIRPDTYRGRLKIGEAPAEIVIRIPGGEEDLGSDGNWIGGVPRFERDEAVILFLRKIKGTRYYYPAFGARGEYVIEDAEIRKDFWEGEYYISIDGGQVYNEYLSRKFGKGYWCRSLQDFKEEIREAVRRLPMAPVDSLCLKHPDSVTTAELLRVSDCVLMGTVQRVEVRLARWDEAPEQGPRPFTFVSIRPEEWLKFCESRLGDGGQQEIVIRISGGTVDQGGGIMLTMLVEWIGGEPRFEQGQKVVVFLTRPKVTPYFDLVMDARGEYTVEDGEVYNEYLSGRFGKDYRPVPLKDFMAELRSLLK